MLELLLESEEAWEWVSKWLEEQVEARQSATDDDDGAGPTEEVC